MTTADLNEFQSAPAPKSGRYRGRGDDRHDRIVSIRARSEERAILNESFSTVDLTMFQSAPAPKSGRYGRMLTAKEQEALFQSAPAPKSGRYV